MESGSSPQSLPSRVSVTTYAFFSFTLCKEFKLICPPQAKRYWWKSVRRDRLMQTCGMILGKVSSSGWKRYIIIPPKSLDLPVDILLQNLQTCFPSKDANSVAAAISTSLDVQSEHDITSGILSTLASFDTASPFTIQRVTELVLFPNRHHAKKAKYLRALDRTLTVLQLN
jgi:hypothetical protein